MRLDQEMTPAANRRLAAPLGAQPTRAHAAGYPWTVVPVERRDACVTALERASVGREIGPFTDFLAELVASNPAARGG